jgi:hypothetical protein
MESEAEAPKEECVPDTESSAPFGKPMEERDPDVAFPPGGVVGEHAKHRAARFQHACDLANGKIEIWYVLENLVVNDNIEGSVVERDARIAHLTNALLIEQCLIDNVPVTTAFVIKIAPESVHTVR